MKIIMKHYYKAKEFVLTQLKSKKDDWSHEISKHVISTAYYAVKHNLTDVEFVTYLEDVTKKTHKKLFCCGCQCSLDTPLGQHISYYEGGGDCLRYAENKFQMAVKKYYEDLNLYNEEDGTDGTNNGGE